jgi:hypothetical protein
MFHAWKHKIISFAFSGLALLLSFPCSVSADEYRIRLLGGLGRTSTDAEAPDMQKSNAHYAVQVLQYIPNDVRGRGWGIEIGKHRVFRSAAGSAEYTEMGMLVEAVLFGIVTAQLGTAGYFAKDSSRHPFGLRASLGRDLMISEHVFLSGFLRDDTIYDQQRITVRSVEIGAGYRF